MTNDIINDAMPKKMSSPLLYFLGMNKRRFPGQSNHRSCAPNDRIKYTVNTALLFSGRRIALALLLTACSLISSARAVERPLRPHFSWDTVPQWLIVRKATAYTQNELKILAGAPVVIFEKANGFQDSGDVERGVLRASSAVKKLNPKVTTLFYWNAVINYPNYKANQAFNLNKDRWTLVEAGVPALIRGRHRIYNLLDVDQQSWWITTAKNVASHHAIDGIFVDSIVKTGGADDGRKPIYPSSSYGKAFIATATRLKDELGDKLLIGNAIRVSEPKSNMIHLKYLDGSYVERWDRPIGGINYSSYVANGMKAISEALADKKIILFNSSPPQLDRDRHWLKYADYASREKWMNEQIQFPLAVFLMVAEEGAYFHWGTGPNVASVPQMDVWRNDIYEEMRRPLGKPLGPARRNGNIFTRRFKYLDVKLDLDRRKAAFYWHDRAIGPSKVQNERASLGCMSRCINHKADAGSDTSDGRDFAQRGHTLGPQAMAYDVLNNFRMFRVVAISGHSPFTYSKPLFQNRSSRLGGFAPIQLIGSRAPLG